MKDKRIEKQVKLLARQKKFEQIYEEYGPYYFREYVSKKYKDEDMKRLQQEGKYLEIHEKYGETHEQINIPKEVEEENILPQTISKKGRLIKIKSILISSIVSAIGSLFGVNIVRPTIDAESTIRNNAKKYEKEIEEYEDEIKEYSKQFDTKKQSDMEIIMRTMKDMHETIRGYGTPEIDATGYLGMDVMEEGGVGVCRNMAENIRDKLNEINPEYNARTIILYQKTANEIKNNIENNQIKDNQIINTKGNIKKVYEDGKLKEQIISQKDKTETYEYEDGKLSSKIIKTKNQIEEEKYDNNGEIIESKKDIIEYNGDSEIQKIFVNGKLETKREKNSNYYISTNYNEDGEINFETIANKEEEKTTFYDFNGKINFVTILKNGYKTTIHYDEQGNEIEKEKEKEKTDETNIFMELEKSSEMMEKLQEQENEKTIFKPLANHAMLAIDIESDNVTLLIDPTILSLGVYKDGNIQMFNEQKPDKAIYDRRLQGEIALKGIDAIKEYPIDYIKSFREPKLSMEELEEKYGLEAQNKMLEQIEKEDNKKTFKEELKIDKGITYNPDTNVVTIDNQQREDIEGRE